MLLRLMLMLMLVLLVLMLLLLFMLLCLLLVLFSRCLAPLQLSLCSPVLKPDLDTAGRHIKLLCQNTADRGVRLWVLGKRLFENLELGARSAAAMFDLERIIKSGPKITVWKLVKGFEKVFAVVFLGLMMLRIISHRIDMVSWSRW
ncbi:hypothetical protein BCR43DRAFT_491118 [Syncephalastrum racemosum]|uniref:Uncharacterized protein n=1 Tax=Syncephalastrum racemosum TaxID=13706 RepID=A0A1X2HBG6_SYNRA|nr:hypothetical protein BCR43DRAFT_491118 [Syncephalastrum racemosum]